MLWHRDLGLIFHSSQQYLPNLTNTSINGRKQNSMQLRYYKFGKMQQRKIKSLVQGLYQSLEETGVVLFPQ